MCRDSSNSPALLISSPLGLCHPLKPQRDSVPRTSSRTSHQRLSHTQTEEKAPDFLQQQKDSQVAQTCCTEERMQTAALGSGLLLLAAETGYVPDRDSSKLAAFSWGVEGDVSADVPVSTSLRSTQSFTRVAAGLPQSRMGLFNNAYFNAETLH